jgi:hypothetical protein
VLVKRASGYPTASPGVVQAKLAPRECAGRQREAGGSFEDGTGAAARFRSPGRMTVDPAGRVAVTDVDNNVTHK